jgi:hypothetical protein
MQLVLAILFLVAILLQYNTISMHCQYIGGGNTSLPGTDINTLCH